MKHPFFYFNLVTDKENCVEVINDIEKDVDLHGANLWILIFAIFIASLGLNVNSTAVIIGAMLISPLMGPIMGLGLGMGINDLSLLRKSLFSYLFAAGIGLATSTLYFTISPINAAHSEILARTSPNIYDVLIAFFGGLAGIVAVSFKHKGNVIPGVAIATALMPPLCTAGYGVATSNWAYFLGAFYLFLINSVFIALATLIAVRFLKFPSKKLLNPEAETKAKRIAYIIVISTLLPSLYLGYKIVQQERFTQNAIKFIRKETNFQNDYLLEKSIDANKKSILLVYGGKKILPTEIEQLRGKLAYYDLGNAELTVKQGFENMNESRPTEIANPLKQVLVEKDRELLVLNATLDSLRNTANQQTALLKEAKALYPNLMNLALTPLPVQTDSSKKVLLVYLQYSKLPGNSERKQVQNWLDVKLNKETRLVFGQ